MISHNPFKEVIEITQSEAGKKKKALRSNFHVMNFSPRYKILQNSILYLPDILYLQIQN